MCVRRVVESESSNALISEAERQFRKLIAGHRARVLDGGWMAFFENEFPLVFEHVSTMNEILQSEFGERASVTIDYPSSPAPRGRIDFVVTFDNKHSDVQFIIDDECLSTLKGDIEYPRDGDSSEAEAKRSAFMNALNSVVFKAIAEMTQKPESFVSATLKAAH